MDMGCREVVAYSMAASGLKPRLSFCVMEAG